MNKIKSIPEGLYLKLPVFAPQRIGQFVQKHWIQTSDRIGFEAYIIPQMDDIHR